MDDLITRYQHFIHISPDKLNKGVVRKQHAF
jgi:hypothetical protein